VLATAASLLSAVPARGADAEPLSGAREDVTLHIEPDDAYGPVLDFIRSARTTLDYTIYQFNDDRIEAALIAAVRRGVQVRVTFTWQTFPASSNTYDPSSEQFNANAPTMRRLRAAGVEVRWSPFLYVYSHQKTMIADGYTSRGRALIMDFNAQPSYFVGTEAFGPGSTRGFMIENRNLADVQEIQQVFEADWERRAPAPFTRPHLVWSPNGPGFVPVSEGQRRIFALIDTARTRLDLYVLLLDYLPFQRRLEQAARRGVDVRVITNTSSPAFTYNQLAAMSRAGIRFAFDPQFNGGTMFVHSKAIIRDAGTGDAMAFVGSQNSGDRVSMNAERELGILIQDLGIVRRMNQTFEGDWSTSTPLALSDGVPVNPFPAYRVPRPGA
jgi:phosphatidylserine/phosphatidylglycerophosphate/cardiolipin synthase-like enzyme